MHGLRFLEETERRETELVNALKLFLRYAPFSGDVALMIRASQSGGNEAHERANKLIEHYSHLDEAHDAANAALSHPTKEAPSSATQPGL